MYTITSPQYLYISSGVHSASLWFINDKPKNQKSEKILQQYISDAQIVFVRKTKILSNFDRVFSANDEKQLSDMLGLLIDARKIWEEEA